MVDNPTYKIFENVEDTCVPHGSVGFGWTAEGVGFGQLYFRETNDCRIICDNELMSREFIKRMLCKMVDDCILESEIEQAGSEFSEA